MDFLWCANLSLFSAAPFFLRCKILNLFGAKIHSTARIYPSVKVWAPWNLSMAPHSCLGPFVDCYNVDKISIGQNSIVSQGSTLCTGSHDYTSYDLPLQCSPITIGDDVWVCAQVFVAAGVNLEDGCVIGVRSVVLHDQPKDALCAGAPSRFKKMRFTSD